MLVELVSVDHNEHEARFCLDGDLKERHERNAAFGTGAGLEPCAVELDTLDAPDVLDVTG